MPLNHNYDKNVKIMTKLLFRFFLCHNLYLSKLWFCVNFNFLLSFWFFFLSLWHPNLDLSLVRLFFLVIISSCLNFDFLTSIFSDLSNLYFFWQLLQYFYDNYYIINLTSISMTYNLDFLPQFRFFYVNIDFWSQLTVITLMPWFRLMLKYWLYVIILTF